MTSRRLPQLALLAAFLPPCAPAYADEVKVTALRNPVDKSYRKMVAGMDLFERQHALAPEAPLRFKLLPRKRDTDMRAIELDMVKGISDFKLLDIGYQAALQSYAQIQKLSLFNFIN